MGINTCMSYAQMLIMHLMIANVPVRLLLCLPFSFAFKATVESVIITTSYYNYDLSRKLLVVVMHHKMIEHYLYCILLQFSVLKKGFGTTLVEFFTACSLSLSFDSFQL